MIVIDSEGQRRVCHHALAYCECDAIRESALAVLCWPAAAQPIPADNEAVDNLIRNYLAKIASPSIYSFVFEITPPTLPDSKLKSSSFRGKTKWRPAIDELQSGWEWLIRAGPRLDLIDAVG